MGDYYLTVASGAIGFVLIGTSAYQLEIAFCLVTYRFLVEEKEIHFINWLFKVNYAEPFDESKKYFRQGQPSARSELNLEAIVKGAYQHPCEVGAFEFEYVKVLSTRDRMNCYGKNSPEIHSNHTQPE
ncbi:MAG: hypothetical protein P4M11_14210 [Candidatus Pacebacteria bacterium]|nr:hypothetical protein [Candidatus Paceibacterota bacterium]